MRRKRIFKMLIAAVALIAFSACGILFAGAADKDVKMQNEYLSVYLQHDNEKYGYDRFALFDVREERMADVESELMYSRFNSSFTTIKVNGETYLYGDGTVVDKPHFDGDLNAVISSESFDGINITQKLSFVSGYSKIKDMLKIEYEIENKTQESANVGIRIMIDPMVYDNDNGVLTVNDKVITNETEYQDIPQEWIVENPEKNIKIFGLTECENQPDLIQFVNWNNVYENTWGYQAEENKIEDTAVALTWRPQQISSGGLIDLSTKYGFKSQEEEVIPSPTIEEVKPSPTIEESDNQESENQKPSNQKPENQKPETQNPEIQKQDNDQPQVILPEESKEQDADKNKKAPGTADYSHTVGYSLSIILSLVMIAGLVWKKKGSAKE